jgi:two-component system nitrate/nitrite response regulator NarL
MWLCWAKWISAALLNRIAAAAQKSHANPNIGLGKFTVREHEIVKLLRYGHTNKAIAHQMRISEGTVKVHLHNIYRKSAIPNRTALAAVEAAGDDIQSDAD